MACATLKRSRDWECISGAGNAGPGSGQVTPLNQQLSPLPAKRRRCAPLVGQPCSSASSSYDNRTFHQDNSARLTPERMAQEIYDEIKRLQHRRQLKLSNASTSCSSRVDNDGSSSGSEGDSPQHPHSRALFTFKQVRVICERMLREQEAALRAEFEAALNGQLAEQYEAFVRFNLDQIQRRHNNSQDISYLS